MWAGLPCLAPSSLMELSLPTFDMVIQSYVMYWFLDSE